MRRMNLAALVPEPSTHPLANCPRPARTGFRREPHVESHTRVDVPQAEARDDPEKNHVARNQERRIQIYLLFRYRNRLVSPWEDVARSKEDEQEQHEGHRQKRDITL